MALTNTALKALKPRHKPYIVTDGRGLYVEVFPTGGVAWRYRYRLNDKTEKLTLGRYPALSLENARARRDQAASMVAVGQSPAARKQLAKRGHATAPTAAQFGDRYFREVVSKDRRDVTVPRRYFDKEIVPAIGAKPLRDVSTEDVRTIIWRRKEHGFDAAAGQIRGLLKRMFDYALTCGVATANPVLALPMRHVYRAKSRERTLSPDEIGVFLKALFEVQRATAVQGRPVPSLVNYGPEVGIAVGPVGRRA